MLLSGERTVRGRAPSVSGMVGGTLRPWIRRETGLRPCGRCSRRCSTRRMCRRRRRSTPVCWGCGRCGKSGGVRSRRSSGLGPSACCCCLTRRGASGRGAAHPRTARAGLGTWRCGSTMTRTRSGWRGWARAAWRWSARWCGMRVGGRSTCATRRGTRWSLRRGMCGEGESGAETPITAQSRGDRWHG